MANLIAALHRFPMSMTATIESEREEQAHLLKPDQSLLNVTTNTQEYPQNFGRQQPPAQQKLSANGSLSLLPWRTAPRQIEAAIARREAAVLWRVAPRRYWPLTRVGCCVMTPQVVSHRRELIQSPSTRSARSAVAQLIFFYSDALQQPAEKQLHQERPLRSRLSSGDPALSRQVSYRTAPGNELLKLVNLAKVADNPPRAEQAPSNDIKGDRGRKRFIFEKQLQEDIKSRRASKTLKNSGSFVRKSFRPDKKPSLRKVLNRAKNRWHLGQPRVPILRHPGRSRSADAGLFMKSIKFLGRKPLKTLHSHSTGPSDGQHWLQENQAASSPESHHSLFTLMPPAAVPRRQPPSDQPSSTVAINLDLIADNSPKAEQAPSEGIKEGRGRKQPVFEEPLRKNVRSYRATKCLRETAGFIRKSSWPDKKPSFLKADNPDTMAGNARETEQLSSNSEEWLCQERPLRSPLSSGDPALKGDIEHEQLVFKIHHQEHIESKRASKHPVSSSSSGCLDHHYFIGEGESAEQRVETCRLREAIAAACPYNYSSDEYSGISYRPPAPCLAAGLFTTNQIPSTDYYWI